MIQQELVITPILFNGKISGFGYDTTHVFRVAKDH